MKLIRWSFRLLLKQPKFRNNNRRQQRQELRRLAGLSADLCFNRRDILCRNYSSQHVPVLPLKPLLRLMCWQRRVLAPLSDKQLYNQRNNRYGYVIKISMFSAFCVKYFHSLIFRIVLVLFFLTVLNDAITRLLPCFFHWSCILPLSASGSCNQVNPA